ncbi:unnamed protein product, partial [Allacma fusca]
VFSKFEQTWARRLDWILRAGGFIKIISKWKMMGGFGPQGSKEETLLPQISILVDFGRRGEAWNKIGNKIRKAHEEPFE